jgi:hypothetical protein
MDLDHELICWNSRWGLSGNLVVCTRCFAHQEAADSHEPFDHMPGCEGIGDGLYPWKQLRDILSAVVDG